MYFKPTYKYAIAILATIVALAYCVGCKKFDTIDNTSSTPPSNNISIEQLRSLVSDKTITIEQELVIGGFVTSCDRAGNFYRTFTFEDSTGGAEIMAGLYDLHNIFPLGYYVSVNLKDCTLSNYNGMLQIGRKAKSYSNYPTDYFYSQVLLNKHAKCYDIYQPVLPKITDIEHLTTDMCGRLVCIDNLKLCSKLHPDAWQVNQEGKWKGYNAFCDTKGNIIAINTSEYASYAENYIPTEQISITGILQRGVFNGEECFLIKMRNEEDCSILH